MARSTGPPDATLAFPARARHHLLFRILLAHISDPGTHRPSGDFARWKLSSNRCPIPRTLAAILVCADFALVLKRIGHAEFAVLGGSDRLGTAGAQSVAARNARGLLRLLSLIRKC